MSYLIQILSSVSLISLIILISRKIPILMQLPRQPEVTAPHQTIWQWLVKLKLSEYFILLINLLEKGLRKIRVVFLRVDNLFIQLIQKTREKSQVLNIRYEAWIKQLTTRKVRVRHEEEKEKTLLVRDLRAEEEILIRAIAKNPRDIASYRKLGDLYIEQKNYSDAREAFNRILKINPVDEEAMVRLEEIAKINSAADDRME